LFIGISSSKSIEPLQRKLEKQLAFAIGLPPANESLNGEMAVTAQASSTIDGTTLTTGPATTDVLATKAGLPLLASPFIYTLASLSSKPAPAKPSKKSRFPSDFLSTRAYNVAACYGEALNIL
jgi:hypothetical protein